MSFRSVLSLCKTEPRRAWTWAKVSSLYVLLQDFSDSFTKGTDDLGSTDLITHTINTGDAQPLRQAPRSVPLAMREVAEKVVQDMLSNGQIEPSNKSMGLACRAGEEKAREHQILCGLPPPECCHQKRLLPSPKNR